MGLAKLRSQVVAIAVLLCVAAAMAADKDNWLVLQRVGTVQPELLSVVRELPDQRARERFPVLIEVKWGYKGLPNGMPTEEELVLGKRLEDGLDRVFGAQGMHVITRTGDAARSMLYYVENAERHAPALKVLFDSLPPLSVEIRARDEPDWDTVKEVREAIK